MAESGYLPGLAIRDSPVADPPRHSAIVRITHWITTLSFLGLLVSGVAILLAHPRLYWGETGTVGTSSLIDLPIPLILGHSGWGRYLHFLSAWVSVWSGLLYGIYGFLSGHFARNLAPEKGDLGWRPILRVVSNRLRWKQPSEKEELSYNVLQRLTYLGVVFVLFPLVILSGLAMSPAITSVVPGLAEMFGGHQSARTIHFFVSSFLILFLFVHVAMVCLHGFTNRMEAMTTGHRRTRKVP